MRKLSKIFYSDAKPADWGILVSVIILLALGVLMVYSSSSALSLQKLGDTEYFLKRHVIFLIVGLVGMFTLINIDYRVLKKAVYPAYLFGLIILILVLIPGIGKEVGGARRWIDLGFIGFQPSEFAKYILILYLSYSITKKWDKMDTLVVGFISHIFMGGIYIILILMEPDFGMATIMLISVFGMLYVGGIRFKYLAISGVASIMLITWAIVTHGYRMNRIIAYLNPWNDPLGSGYQAVQSFTALGLGGVMGVGLGNSSQKLFFLPEAHTDFIFSIIGEELGFIGIFAVVMLFGFLLIRGIKVALRAPDTFGSMLALGCIMILTLQAVTNMSVAVGILPTKGLTLPFISYGGTSLVSSMGAVGVLLSVSRAKKE